MKVPDFTFKVGDVLAVHTRPSPWPLADGWLSGIIQRAQRKRTGNTMGAEVNHVALVVPTALALAAYDWGLVPRFASITLNVPVAKGEPVYADPDTMATAEAVIPGEGVVEAREKGVTLTTLADWFAYWVDPGRGEWALCLRVPGLTVHEAMAVSNTAHSFRTRPYDVATLIRLCRVYSWWRPMRSYARYLAWRHRPTPGAMTCSEVLGRSLSTHLDQFAGWRAKPDAVAPWMLVDSPALEIVWSSALARVLYGMGAMA